MMIKDEALVTRLSLLAQTQHEEKGRYRIAAAVLDKSGKVLSTAVNSYTKTHPKQDAYSRRLGHTHKPFLHAELSAIIKATGGEPYKIVVVRVGKSGDLLLAKPCPICMLAIKEAGIKIIEHTL